MTKASKLDFFFPPGAAGHADKVTYLSKGLTGLQRRGGLDGAFPICDKSIVYNTYYYVVFKNMWNEKSGKVQKVTQGWRRIEERALMRERRWDESVGLGFVSVFKQWRMTSEQFARRAGAAEWQVAHQGPFYMEFLKESCFPHRCQSLWKIPTEGASSHAAVDWRRDAGAALTTAIPKLP